MSIYLLTFYVINFLILFRIFLEKCICYSVFLFGIQYFSLSISVKARIIKITSPNIECKDIFKYCQNKTFCVIIRQIGGVTVLL